jgi:hypothetical protein
MTVPTVAPRAREKLPEGWSRHEVIYLVRAVAELYPSHADVMPLLELLTDYPELSRSMLDPLVEYVASVEHRDACEELVANLNTVLAHLVRHSERARGLAQVMAQAESAEAA